MKVVKKLYNNLTTIEDVFNAWLEFKRNKMKKRDVLIFEKDLEDNLFQLQEDLKNKKYKHGKYTKFYIHVAEFLQANLKLELHSRKTKIRKLLQGMDFCGVVILPYCRVLRTKTKHRMCYKMACRKLEFENNVIDDFALNQTKQSYLGLLQHCDSHKLRTQFSPQLAGF